VSCACGMDSVGTCLLCKDRLCTTHALRGEESPALTRAIWDSGIWPIPPDDAFQVHLSDIQSSLRPFFRFRDQRRAFTATLFNTAGVICCKCRIDAAFEAARSVRCDVPVLRPGGSHPLRDAAVAWLLGDVMVQEMSKEVLLHDLVRLARENGEVIRVAVEWEAEHVMGASYRQGAVRATEDVYQVLDVMVQVSNGWDEGGPSLSPRFVNKHGQWGPITHSLKPETVRRGLFSKEKILRASWTDVPQANLTDAVRSAAKLLKPAE